MFIFFTFVTVLKRVIREKTNYFVNWVSLLALYEGTGYRVS